MSKLYTEEQVRYMLSQARFQDYNDCPLYSDDAIIEEQTPIELPTDEEILEESKIGGMDTSQGLCFQLGAKWMRDKIKGGGE